MLKDSPDGRRSQVRRHLHPGPSQAVFAAPQLRGADSAARPATSTRTPEQRKALNPTLPGIPYDSLNNQMMDWVMEARKANATLFQKPTFLVIKGDGDAGRDRLCKPVIKNLQEKDINRFNLHYDLEMKPVA
ncbi:MAG: hypothetical protein WKG07_11275 [Hymenobacter sp.]